MAISFSAFSVDDIGKHLHSGEKWFHFIGISPGDLNKPSKYVLDGSTPSFCTNLTLQYRCEIDAMPQSGNPSLPDLSTIVGETKRNTP